MTIYLCITHIIVQIIYIIYIESHHSNISRQKSINISTSSKKLLFFSNFQLNVRKKESKPRKRKFQEEMCLLNLFYLFEWLWYIKDAWKFRYLDASLAFHYLLYNIETKGK